MKVYNESIEISTPVGKLSYHNVTKEVKEIFKKSGIKEGVCFVFTPHTTCGIVFDEYMHDMTEDGDEFLQADLNNVLDKIVPKFTEEPRNYLHPGKLHVDFAISVGANEYLTSNTDAHLRSTLIGNNSTIPVYNGELQLGKYGSLYFVDFDHRRERVRNCIVHIMGN